MFRIAFHFVSSPISFFFPFSNPNCFSFLLVSHFFFQIFYCGVRTSGGFFGGLNSANGFDDGSSESDSDGFGGGNAVDDVIMFGEVEDDSCIKEGLNNGFNSRSGGLVGGGGKIGGEAEIEDEGFNNDFHD